jgi:hypothetical protein
MATAVVSRPLAATYLAAAARARAEGLEARRLDSGAWSVKSYLVTPTGPRPIEVRCSCDAGRTAHICKHVCPVIYGRRHGLAFVRCLPTAATCPNCGELAALGHDGWCESCRWQRAACDEQESDPVHERQLAITRRMRDEANIDRSLALITGKPRLTLVAPAGVDPLADLFG